MNIQNLENSIRSTVAELQYGFNDLSGTVDNIMSMIMSEIWTHKAGEMLGLGDLTDAEYRVLSHWLVLNRWQYRDKDIMMIKDMREVFPGLGLKAAKELVRGR